MKKLFFILLLCLSISIGLCSCLDIGNNSTEDPSQNAETPELSVEYIYELAKNSGYDGTVEQFIEEFKGKQGEPGTPGAPGADGVGIADAGFDENAHLILILTNGEKVDCGKISINVESSGSTSLSIGANGNWYINGEDTGKRAEAIDGTTWHTGTGAPISTVGIDGDLYLNTKNCDLYKKVLGAWTLIANIAGEGITVNEGDNYDITLNTNTEPDRYTAAKALMSAVRVEAVFSGVTTQYQQVSNGAGVIYKLDKAMGDAYIITNYHVVYDADALTYNNIADSIGIYLYGMEYSDYKIEAKYVGGSMTYDIAVLKVTDSELLRTSAVRAVELADSSDVRALDTAIAIGNPASSGISVTKGCVSVVSEYLEMIAPDNHTTVEYRVMRIDTPVNSGNSGGGLFNSDAKLIGIVNAKENDSSLENMGYAIPSNLAVYVAENIIRNCDGNASEQVKKCVIGMMITLSDIKTEYNTETGVIDVIETAVIQEISTGSIAESVLMVGDVIKSFEIDGVTYEVKHNYDGGEILLNADADSEVYINVEREGTPLRVKLEITEDNFSRIS